MGGPRRLAAALAVLALLVAGCSSGWAGQTVVTGILDPGHGHGIYPVSAVDYHFHDAHPTVPLTPGRELVIWNEGGRLHNVTIPAVGFSRDFLPHHEIVVGRIGDVFPGPGRYQLFCKYHVAQGMHGVIVVVPNT